MINGNIEDFIDKIHYGEDIYLIYGKEYLFIDGWWENGIYFLRMQDFNLNHVDSIYNFTISNSDNNKAVEEFLSKEIWNGKKFMDEIKNIEWSEPFDVIPKKN